MNLLRSESVLVLVLSSVLAGCITKDLAESEYPSKEEIEIAFKLKSLTPQKPSTPLELKNSAQKPLCLLATIRRIRTSEKDEGPEFVFQSEDMEPSSRDLTMFFFKELALLDSFEATRAKAGVPSPTSLVKLNNKGIPYFYKLNSEKYCVQAAKMSFTGITNIPGAKGRAVPLVPLIPAELKSLYPFLKEAYKIKINVALTDEAPWIASLDIWKEGEQIKWIRAEKAYSFNIAKYQGMWLPAEYVQELVKKEQAASYASDAYTKLLDSVKKLYLEAKFEEKARDLNQTEIRSLLNEGLPSFNDKGTVILPISFNYKVLEPDIGDPENNVITVSNQYPYNAIMEAKAKSQNQHVYAAVTYAEAEVNWRLQTLENLELLVKHKYAYKSNSADGKKTIYTLTKDFSFQSSDTPSSPVIYTKFKVYDYSFAKVVKAKEIDTGDHVIEKITVELTGSFKPQAKSLIEENPGLFNPYKRFTIIKTKPKNDKLATTGAANSQENTKNEKVEVEFGY